jgi:hypothetical protein
MICVEREEEWKYVYIHILQEHICIKETSLKMQSMAKGNTEMEFREV